MTTTENTPSLNPLPRITKLIYGSGDWGRATFNTLRQFFYAIFLTDVVGLDPRLASFAALISIIWDAINDPLVGALSDNVKTRWGRRRPFLLLFSLPFWLAFLMLWWAPPWHTQSMLMIHVTLAYMVSDTIQTLVTVPYLSLTPELAVDYDERTSLTSYRMFFNLLASLVTAVAAPSIIDMSLAAGHSLQQSYLIVAGLFGGLSVIPFLLLFFTIREKEVIEDERTANNSLTFRKTIMIFLTNTPFKYATGIYILNWISVDIVALMLPYFLLYWVAQGNLMAKADFLGLNMPLESIALGVLLSTAAFTIPLWNWLSKRYSKRTAYIIGLTFWVAVQTFAFSIQPGQMNLIILLAFLAGFGVSSAHIIPEAMFPDVIDWDEFRTHTRREGMYYGAINFLRKLSSAFAIFLTLQILGWSGYQSPPPDSGLSVFMQSPQTTLTIRLLTGPFIILLLVIAIFLTWFYPLTRERQARIRTSLTKREQKRNKKKK